MEVGEVVNIAQALKTQSIESERQSLVLLKMKESQELQLSLAAKLLGSLPGANPDGVGANCDCCG